MQPFSIDIDLWLLALLQLLRLLISSGLTGTKEYYEEKLDGIADFPFDEYKSSNWKSLGEHIFDEYFTKNI